MGALIALLHARGRGRRDGEGVAQAVRTHASWRREIQVDLARRRGRGAGEERERADGGIEHVADLGHRVGPGAGSAPGRRSRRPPSRSSSRRSAQAATSGRRRQGRRIAPARAGSARPRASPSCARAPSGSWRTPHAKRAPALSACPASTISAASPRDVRRADGVGARVDDPDRASPPSPSAARAGRRRAPP